MMSSTAPSIQQDQTMTWGNLHKPPVSFHGMAMGVSTHIFVFFLGFLVTMATTQLLISRNDKFETSGVLKRLL